MEMEGHLYLKHLESIMKFVFRNVDYFEKDGERCGYHKIDSETRTKLEVVGQEAEKTFYYK